MVAFHGCMTVFSWKMDCKSAEFSAGIGNYGVIKLIVTTFMCAGYAPIS
jgi:hypothetical protein